MCIHVYAIYIYMCVWYVCVCVYVCMCVVCVCVYTLMYIHRYMYTGLFINYCTYTCI